MLQAWVLSRFELSAKEQWAANVGAMAVEEMLPGVGSIGTLAMRLVLS